MLTAIEAATAEDFSQALRRAVAVDLSGEPRLCRLLAHPESPLRVLQGFARSVLAGARAFPGLLAALIEHAPNPQAQMVLTRNLLGEEGMCVVPGRGIVSRPELRHLAWAEAFARACGCDEASAGQANFSIDASRLATLSQREGWLRAVAYFLLGQEGSFARVCPLIEQALRRRGLPPEALVFFERHAEQDLEHGDEALQLLVANVQNDVQRDACLLEARRGAEHWFAQYA